MIIGFWHQKLILAKVQFMGLDDKIKGDIFSIIHQYNNTVFFDLVFKSKSIRYWRIIKLIL